MASILLNMSVILDKMSVIMYCLISRQDFKWPMCDWAIELGSREQS
jgi:hypothetical protein